MDVKKRLDSILENEGLLTQEEKTQIAMIERKLKLRAQASAETDEHLNEIKWLNSDSTAKKLNAKALISSLHSFKRVKGLQGDALGIDSLINLIQAELDIHENIIATARALEEQYNKITAVKEVE